MKKVTKQQFYAAIGPRNIYVTSNGLDHSRFETPERIEVGRVYETDEYDDNARKIHNYFLTNEKVLK